MTPGIEGPLIAPGSPQWWQTMSASKIAAVVGCSPWTSRFALHFQMAGILPREPQTDEMARGLYLEDGIAAWFRDRHPELAVLRSGTWRHRTHPWMTAAPDRKLYGPSGLTALLELKTSNDWWEWGTPGTDEIPPYYKVQVQWQMAVTGVPVCYVVVLTGFLEFVEYVVHYDPNEALWLRIEAEMFLDDLANNRRPPIDSHEQTYVALRELAPGIDGLDVDIDEDLARRFCAAKAGKDAAEAEWSEARSLVADAMGEAKRARWGDFTIANRKSRDGGKPWVEAGRKLPVFDDIDTEREAA